MSEETPEHNKPEDKPPFLWKKLIWRLIKISLITGAVLFGLLTVLARMGGSSDVLKSAVEDFFTGATPYTAHVSTLNSIQFFPNISLDAENIEFRHGDDGTGEAAIRIESLKFSARFIDVLFRPGHVQGIAMNNLVAYPGSVSAQTLKLDTVEIKTVEAENFIDIQGVLGDTPLYAKIDLIKKGSARYPVYTMGNARDVEINLGDLKFTSIVKNKTTGGVALENFMLSVGREKALRGNLDIVREDGVLNVKGQIRLQPGSTQLDPDINIAEDSGIRSISGSVKSELLVLDDLSAAVPFAKAINAIGALLGGKSSGFGLDGLNLDLNLDARNIKAGAVALGNVKTPIILKDSDLHIGPLDGRIVKGTLGGDVKINASDASAKLESAIKIKGFDYAALQKQFADEAQIEGTADIVINLNAEGKTWSALASGLSGKAGFVGGEGRIQSGLLNVWGGGLLGALLPKLEKEDDLNLKCVVANFDIEGLKADSDAVFIDTQRITLKGSGTYDIGADKLDMVFDPKPKDVSIGDISSAVNVAGPLGDLKASPNVYDLGKKVGGLLLGAVNPALYAVMLTNLGLRDDHPCKAFVIEKEALPPPSKLPEITETP